MSGLANSVLSSLLVSSPCQILGVEEWPESDHHQMWASFNFFYPCHFVKQVLNSPIALTWSSPSISLSLSVSSSLSSRSGSVACYTARQPWTHEGREMFVLLCTCDSFVQRSTKRSFEFLQENFLLPFLICLSQLLHFSSFFFFF